MSILFEKQTENNKELCFCREKLVWKQHQTKAVSCGFASLQFSPVSGPWREAGTCGSCATRYSVADTGGAVWVGMVRVGYMPSWPNFPHGDLRVL